MSPNWSVLGQGRSGIGQQVQESRWQRMEDIMELSSEMPENGWLGFRVCVRAYLVLLDLGQVCVFLSLFLFSTVCVVPRSHGRRSQDQGEVQHLGGAGRIGCRMPTHPDSLMSRTQNALRSFKTNSPPARQRYITNPVRPLRQLSSSSKPLPRKAGTRIGSCCLAP